jgi:O-antigen/teichoic acid export membrane protein
MSILGKLHARMSSGDFTTRFLGRSFAAFSIKLGSAGLSFVMFVLLARAMGRDDYGYFGSIFSLTMLLAVVGSLGQRPLVLRFGASYHETQSDTLRRGVIWRGYAVVLAGCLTVGCVGAVIFQYFGGGLDMRWIAAIVALTVAWALVEYQSFVMRISSGVALALMPRDIIWRLLICGLAGLAALGFLPGSIGTRGWIWIMAGSLLVIGAVQFGLNERGGETQRIFGPADMRHSEWNAPMRHLWLSSVIMIAAQSLSVILIERQIGPDQAGPYFSALRTAQLLNLFLFATSVICSPMLSRSMTRGDREETQKVCTLTATVGGGFGAAGFLMILVAGGFLMRLFGEGFDSATPALIILAAGFLVNTLAGPTGPLLEMSGHERAYFRVLFVANTIGIAVMPLAIIYADTIGAALCTAGIAIAWNIAAVVYCRRKLGIDPSLAVFLLGKPAAKKMPVVSDHSKGAI